MKVNRLTPTIEHRDRTPLWAKPSFIQPKLIFAKANIDAVGVKRIILSQEPCPDYVVEMIDGQILRM